MHNRFFNQGDQCCATVYPIFYIFGDAAWLPHRLFPFPSRCSTTVHFLDFLYAAGVTSKPLVREEIPGRGGPRGLNPKSQVATRHPPSEGQSRSVASWFVAFAAGFAGWKPADKSKMNNLPVPQLPGLFLRGLTRAGVAAAAFPPEDRRK